MLYLHQQAERTSITLNYRQLSHGRQSNSLRVQEDARIRSLELSNYLEIGTFPLRLKYMGGCL